MSFKDCFMVLDLNLHNVWAAGDAIDAQKSGFYSTCKKKEKKIMLLLLKEKQLQPWKSFCCTGCCIWLQWLCTYTTPTHNTDTAPTVGFPMPQSITQYPCENNDDQSTERTSADENSPVQEQNTVSCPHREGEVRTFWGCLSERTHQRWCWVITGPEEEPLIHRALTVHWRKHIEAQMHKMYRM